MKHAITPSLATLVWLFASLSFALRGAISVPTWATAAPAGATAASAGGTRATAGTTATASQSNGKDTGGGGGSTGSGAAKGENSPTGSLKLCRSVTGLIVSKDDVTKSFILHPKGQGDRTFTTDRKTSYRVGEVPATWGDLAKDQNVHVTCVRSGTAEIARTVKIKVPVTAGNKPR